MFKKPFTVSKSHTLKSSDKKKLIQEVLKQFKNVTEEQLNEVISKKQEVSVYSTKIEVKKENAKPGSDDKKLIGISIFCVDDTPVFFDVKPPDYNIYPTVYALWKLPTLMAPLYVHSPVSQFLFNGADLMLPGLTLESKTSSFAKNDKRMVLAKGNPFPFAVGKMAIDSVQAQKKEFKGKGLTVIHVFGDSLWKFGNKSVPDGFTESRVYAITKAPEIDDEDIAPEILQQQLEQVSISGTPQQAEQGTATTTETSSSGEIAAVVAPTLTETATTTVQEKPVAESTDSKEEDEEAEESDGDEKEEEGDKQGTQVSKEEQQQMDQTLELCFMESTKNLIKDEDLPMEIGALLSRMMDCRPEGFYLDLKRSSFKKLAKFIKLMQKKKRIKTKELKTGTVVVSINRSHPDYKKHKFEFKIAQKPEIPNPEATTTSSSSKQASKPQALKVIPLFKVNSNVIPLFALNAEFPPNKDTYFTEEEISEYLVEYAKFYKLFANEHMNHLKLDEYLLSFFGAKEDYRIGTTVSKETMFKRIIAKMNPAYAVQREDGEYVIKKGQCSGVTVEVGSIMGNKAVTKLFGLEEMGIDFQDEEFKKDLRQTMASSVKTREPGTKPNPQDPDVLIQGNVSNQVVSWLKEQYGIPARFIQVNDKIKAKKKKK